MMLNRSFLLFFLVALSESKEALHRRAFKDKFGNVTIKDVPYDTSISSRIAGGTEAEPHSYPHMAALTFYNVINLEWFCCGSLIDPSWVITAAHCVGDAEDVDVLLGAHDINSFEPSQVTVRASILIPHFDYNEMTLHDDIALLKLDTPVTLTPEIQPIALSSSDPNEGTLLSLTGWGAHIDDASYPVGVLHEVDVPTISNEVCSLTYAGPTVYDGVLCVDGSGGSGGCDGDSGAPLNWGEGSRITLAGVFSYSHEDGCDSGDPQRSSRIFYFLPWIEQVSGVTP